MFFFIICKRYANVDCWQKLSVRYSSVLWILFEQNNVYLNDYNASQVKWKRERERERKKITFSPYKINKYVWAGKCPYSPILAKKGNRKDFRPGKRYHDPDKMLRRVDKYKQQYSQTSKDKKKSFLRRRIRTSFRLIN